MLDRPMTTLVLRDLEVRDLGAKLDRVVAQLRAGDFRSAEVKKLKNADLYRARLDEKNRLLFKIGEHGDGRALLLLEVIHNHDYAKARFLRGGACADEDFEPVASPAAASPTEALRYVNPASTALHFLDKPLSFDDAQEAVYAAPLPLILIGPAGSGKTALTLEKLKTLPGHGLYLTRSAYLVENARALYHANGYANAGQEVDFLSLAELIQTIDVPRGREARWADFTAWWGRHRAVFKLGDPHRVWEEIRGVITGGAERGPHLTEEEYLALGVRQSIFLGDERRAVHAVFRKWLAHLADAGLFDANVAAWERRARAPKRYDFLVVDEVQDITTVELGLALATLQDGRTLLLCGDSNQIVHPNLFSWARVKTLFHERNRGADSPLDRIHILSANYRNTRAVTDLANRLLVLKQRRFGSIDRESSYLVDCVSNEEGRVDLVADGPAVRAEIDASTRRSTRTAIIVLRDEDKAGARAVFASPLVFSIHEAKGLEYDNVVLFNLVAAAAREFRDCAEGLAAEDLTGDVAYARPRDKTDKSLDAYKFYLNALYVGLTRAVKSVVLVEAEPAHPFLALLAVKETAERLSLAKSESSLEDWHKEARRLELQGKTEQAEQIRREILQTQPVPWKVLDASTFAEVHAKALTAPFDKASQQLLFEHAVSFDADPLVDALAAAGFRHAKRRESGLKHIAETHHAEYRFGKSALLAAQLRRHGVDFRNPLGETPLIVAAKLGRADLVADLIAQGADPELTDPAGRNAYRAAYAAFTGEQGATYKPAHLEQVVAALPLTPIKVKVGARMQKLDPSTMEWFLLNAFLVEQRRMIADAANGRGMPTATAAFLAEIFARLPDGVLPAYRRRREYLSGMLGKNEHRSPNPHGRRLFVRTQRGEYMLNPILELDVGGAWRRATDVMGATLLYSAWGAAGDQVRRALEKVARGIEELEARRPTTG